LSNHLVHKNYIRKIPGKTQGEKKFLLLRIFDFPAEIIFAAVISLICILLYNFVTQWEYFNVKKIQIKGSVRISEQTIKKCAGINKGINILSVNFYTARKRLLAIPWIAEAQITRLLPSEIQIYIKEHEPAALLDIGKKFVVNRLGKVYKQHSISDPDNLPVVMGLKYSDINELNEFDSIPFKAVMNVLQFGYQFESVLPNSLIESISIDKEIGITLFMIPGNNQVRINRIRLGYNNYFEKYNKLKNLLVYFEKQEDFLRIDSIDLTNLDRVVVNPIRTESLARDHKEV